jgi:iron complex transport system substrate-binding protein
MLALLVIAILAIPACAVEVSFSEGKTVVVDDLGYKTIVEKPPERIVSLAPSNTEILFALGVGGRILGVTEYCNYPPEAKEKSRIGGYRTVSIEKVVALNPDLVVATEGNGIETIEMLRGLGIKTIAFDPKNLDEIMKNIEALGKLTGKEENATELVRFMKDRIEAAKAKNKTKVRVAHLLWHEPIWVSGNNTFIDEVLRLAGGENVFGDLEGWKVVGIEDLISRNPEVILVSSGGGMGGEEDLLYEWVISDKRLKDVRAVRDGRVFVVDADIISRPSYRLVYVLDELVEKFQIQKKPVEKTPGFEVAIALIGFALALRKRF